MSVETYVRLEAIEDGLYRLVLDFPDAPLNVLGRKATNALAEAVANLPTDKIRGLLVVSTKRGFVAGADITEFCESFSKGTSELFDYAMVGQGALNGIEDLPCPTISVVRGEALGGGLEVALSTDLRIFSKNAKVGLPEVNLGIMPGWGGSIRLPRLIGVDNAMQWMLQGRPMKADEALRVGVANAVVDDADLETAALEMLKSAVAGDIDYRSHRAKKLMPLAISDHELEMALTASEGMFGNPKVDQYPAPARITRSVRKSTRMQREDAQHQEDSDFIELAATPTAKSLINLFMSNQALRRENKSYAEGSAAPAKAAVLGAGIMGGGVAYQSASTGTPILMKDISDGAIEAGLKESDRLMLGQVMRGRMKPEDALKTCRRIEPRLDYYGFDSADFVVEAVVENLNVKRAVLAEVEQQVGEATVLATNTSTLTVKEMQDAVQRPENLCGMHFFNPVHRMPLVEIVKGELTSDETVSRAVSYALAMKKLPIVVKDCSGFLVNRILFAYTRAFFELVNEGVDFSRIDRLMEKFGWPMGPAALNDMVGMDTCVHASKIVGDAYPDRMSDFRNAADLLLEAGRLGQKSGAGFYRYELDKKGKPKKKADPEVGSILAPLVTQGTELSDQQVVDRMMLPFCFEAARCLEEKVASSAGAIDTALVNGLGFPRHLGGVFGYMDQLGAAKLVELSEQYQHLGLAYQPPASVIEMATDNKSFYPFSTAVAQH
ncbi:fatty acid oxidation complex subunit alpha FadB [Marinobacterium mangrovicola]|uniref:enoyl-CoA hydratase n=1 Tax=Marinobacterium mangrovicola TaxID=1476959 RepID=A0A4R1GC28_9GAMM|nr:fatty acid oxidation complex subunit alpha FadB [Marinobacterium mangrovicola]TCK04311.1 3-hydroxyacyl-CoA dehydrogenase/enoyl-CoA hydratase/3-hydroxybutyryl-CoA epimerase/enoyl-CoA isomerase [Marinobacterium mangrovicola]